MRRYVLAFGGASVVMIGEVFACSFPDVRFDPPGTVKDSASTVDVVDGQKPPTTTDGQITSPDGAIIFDGACNGPDPTCDCDTDGVKSNVSGCGGLDCDDNDPRIHPDAGFLTDQPAKRSGDWNCDNTVQREGSGLRCTDIIKEFVDAGDPKVACVREGFAEADTACSEPATYVFCKYSGVSIPWPTCNELKTEQRLRGCR